METIDEIGAPENPVEAFSRFPLLDALRERRSRRFALGMKMEDGPMAYESRHSPVPLSETEEAILAFAACGVTGPILSDWNFAPGAGGNMMAGQVGRTAGSADGIQNVVLFVINDKGVFLARRPRDLSASEISMLVDLVARGEFVEAWRRLRVKVSVERSVPPLHPPHNVNANRWSLHRPGTTYFLPVADLTLFAINALLEVFNEDTGLFVVDERNYYRPAGVGRFARSRGGHMDDDPRSRKAAPIHLAERITAELTAVEVGMVLQNLGLACEALGLGGCPSYAYDDEGWFRALGFRMGKMPLSRFFGLPRPLAWGLRLRGRDVPIEYPLGLEHDGQVLLSPYCPPYFSSMADAVRAVVALKFGEHGLFRGGMTNTGWRDPAAVATGIPDVSEASVEATIAFCEYIWSRYGRFPAHYPPFHAVMGFQAHHLDTEFYDRYYARHMLSERHRRHADHWHSTFARSGGVQGDAE
jgi:hypothetical protein